MTDADARTVVKVLGGGAVKAVITELAEAFRQETGRTVATAFAPMGVVRQRLSAGEPADVVIMTDALIEEMVREGVVTSGTRVDIARTGVGVGVRAGAPRPDISTPEAFRRTLLAATSIAYVDPAQGATSAVHFAAVLERLGIADAVKGKSRLMPGGYAAEAVAEGTAELVVHQISEILPVRGVALVGPLPRDLQKVTTYSAAVAARSAAPKAARAFIAFVARPAFKGRFAEAGLDYRERAV